VSLKHLPAPSDSRSCSLCILSLSLCSRSFSRCCRADAGGGTGVCGGRDEGGRLSEKEGGDGRGGSSGDGFLVKADFSRDSIGWFACKEVC